MHNESNQTKMLPKSPKNLVSDVRHSLCGKLSGKRWLLFRRTRSHMNAAAVLWFHIAMITQLFSVTCYNHLRHFLSKEEQETINSLHSGDLYIVPLQSFWWIQGLTVTIVEIIISFNATQTPVKKQTLQQIAKISGAQLCCEKIIKCANEIDVFSHPMLSLFWHWKLPSPQICAKAWEKEGNVTCLGVSGRKLHNVEVYETPLLSAIIYDPAGLYHLTPVFTPNSQTVILVMYHSHSSFSYCRKPPYCFATPSLAYNMHETDLYVPM